MTVTVDAPIDLSTTTIQGYKRADGQVGIRNRLLVLFTVVCAEEVSRRIAWQLDDAVVAGWRDCLPDEGAKRKMIRVAQNPNIAGVLVLSLGCECSDAAGIAGSIADSGKPAELISIQAEGGTKNAIAKGDRTRSRHAGATGRARQHPVQRFDRRGRMRWVGYDFGDRGQSGGRGSCRSHHRQWRHGHLRGNQ